MKATIIAVVGAKGGTTKTATAAALGHLFAETGWRTLLVDLDPQGSLTRRFGLGRVDDPLSVDPYELDLGVGLEAALRLSRGGRSLEGQSEMAISAHLDRAATTEAEIVIVDTPPALGPIVHAVFSRADFVLVPCVPGTESLDGYDDVRTAAHAAGTRCPVRGVLTLTRTNTRVLRWTRGAFSAQLPEALIEEVEVPNEVAAAEAAILRLPVTVSAPTSRSSVAYRRIASTIAREVGLVREVTP